MLTSADRERHTALGIDGALLDRAGVRRVDDTEARAVLGLNGKAGDHSGIEYPYLDPQRPTWRWTSRVRLDHPPLKPDGTPDRKYLAPYGDRRHLYFPPGADALLRDVTVPVVFVEAEKSALALTSAAQRADRRLLVIALGGCWNWRGRIGTDTDAAGKRVDTKGPLPDFDTVTLAQRPTIILFDARPNASVQSSRRQFAQFLTGRGATVQHAHLPDDDRRVNGPDDLIAVHGDAALWRVLDAAVPHDFTRDEDHQVITGSLDNIRLALAKLGVRPTYDAFARDLRIDGRPVDDADLDRLWVRIDDAFRWRPSRENLRTVIVADAHETLVHPVRAYLDALTWDGHPRIDAWLTTYGGAAADAYTAAVGALTLIAAVRRVRQPGAKFDEITILEGPQGTGKSSGLRALCPDEDWFSDDLPLGVDSKQVIERTTGRWIIEAAELHGNRGREAEQLKAFLSRQVDGPVRLAYGRMPTTVPRQFILIGTTNSRLAYLKDSTGARRFWPVAIRQFDVAALTRDRDQLWAEAAAREAAGASIRLDPSLWHLAARAQEDRRASDPWEPLLEPLFEGDGIATVEHVMVSAIWDALKFDDARYMDNRHADRVTAILQRHGFTKKLKRRIGGKPVWCWVRDDATEDTP